ncbi:BUD32 family EKC/KEOPS complex subunit [Mucisphaera calidilacus]|uniref:Uncharacterized protein n=1 Tax=Mucisphaera calidilacus TaxID=2527982 RepID=A0A518BT89_9BACT|nr:hypothetical protein [Mucisphaera calidilacus]QDU70192.1 hypothetical protein Pan265_00140 [Mucisphaera calidilacus]
MIKRFDHSVLRQRLGWWLGLHPVQREVHCAERLAGLGLPVVPIESCGIEGGRGWLMTPYAGPSLQGVLERREASRGQVRAWSRALGRMTGAMLARGWWNRDLKTSNVLVDASGGLWMIDTGGARRTGGRLERPLRVMARLLVKTATQDLGRPLREGERAAFLAGLREKAPLAVSVLRRASVPL